MANDKEILGFQFEPFKITLYPRKQAHGLIAEF